MIDEINYTLLSDGSSDKALMPVIEWTIHQIVPSLLIQGVRADLTRLKEQPKDLTHRIDKALELYPCNVLFIHRDSEGEPHSSRQAEIETATSKISSYQSIVEVIPVRMMEAWLLIDEQAIKTAAGNPNGRYNVTLPKNTMLEKISDPKLVLKNHLKQASGLKGRQLDKFNVGKAVHLVADNIDDFSALKNLPSYRAFVEKLTTVLTTYKP